LDRKLYQCKIFLSNMKKKNSILKLPTKEWHDKSGYSQRPPSRPPKRQGSGHRAEAGHPD
jgi:hypothetical protein